MAPPRATTIAQEIAARELAVEFRHAREVVADFVRGMWLGRSEAEISDHVESIGGYVVEELLRLATEAKRQGLEPFYDLQQDGNDAYIRGTQHAALPLLRSIRALSPLGFETFCADVLALLGADAEVRGGTGDGGVDFTATGLQLRFLGEAPRIAALKGAMPVVLGQAKRYHEGNLILLTDIREFIGGAVGRLEDLRREDRHYRLLGPTTLAFWTSSDFHKSALEYSQKLGIWTLGGRALAQLAQAAGWSPTEEISGPVAPRESDSGSRGS